MTPAVIDSLRRAVDADPGDLGLRSVLADACEEAGDARAADFWRWTVVEDKCPESPADSTCYHLQLKTKWNWHIRYIKSAVDRVNRPCIELELYERLREFEDTIWVGAYDTAIEAFDDLYRAWIEPKAFGIPNRIGRLEVTTETKGPLARQVLKRPG